MRNLWISLLIVICFASVNSQLTGTWNIGWQTNLHPGQCVPDSFIIYQNTTDVFYVNYTYNYQVQAACEIPPEQLSTKLISVGSNLYNDTLGRGMTFVDNSFILLAINGSTVSFFYQKSTDPSLIPQELTLGTLGSFWNTQIDPKLGCCAPDSIFVIPSGPSPTSELNYSTSYISQTCAPNVTNGRLTPFNSNITSINWVDSTTSPTIGLRFTPSTSWMSMVVTFGSGKSSCNYTYRRVNATGPTLNNIWQQDWQTANNPAFPSSYRVNTVKSSDGNATYMMSQYAGIMSVMSGFIVQSGINQYTDSALGRTFQYDPKTGSLLSGNFLYTLNGSLLTPAPYIQFWGAPQVLGDPTDCCYPASINITAHPKNNQSLNVVYTMPDNYTTISGCDDFLQDINKDGVIESTLVIGTPSFTQLVWNDTKLVGTQIYFSNASIPTQITSSFPGQCGFNMIVTKPPEPKPKPGPLFGSSISFSTKVMSIIMGLFIILTCM